MQIAIFDVSFHGKNNLPHFSKPLTSILNIYKQRTAFLWTYLLPSYTDDDLIDIVALDVFLKDTANFMTFDEKIAALTIEDLADPKVPSGTFSVDVILSDGKDTMVSNISVLIYDAPPPISDGAQAQNTTWDLQTSEPVTQTNTNNTAAVDAK